MDKNYRDLGAAITKGVSDALKNTPVTVITKPDQVAPTDYNIISHMRVIKAYCDRFQSCSECDINSVCNFSSPCDWRV